MNNNVSHVGFLDNVLDLQVGWQIRRSFSYCWQGLRPFAVLYQVTLLFLQVTLPGGISWRAKIFDISLRPSCTFA